MKILVKVKVKAGKEMVEKTKAGNYLVFTKEAPEKGKANQAVFRLLAKYFNKPLDCVSIVKGRKSKQKVIEILR